LQAAGVWISGGVMFRAVETECRARGDETCTIVVDKKPLE